MYDNNEQRYAHSLFVMPARQHISAVHCIEKPDEQRKLKKKVLMQYVPMQYVPMQYGSHAIWFPCNMVPMQYVPMQYGSHVCKHLTDELNLTQLADTLVQGSSL